MRPLRIGLVAGEASGDLLGAGLIRAIKNRYPDAVFEGIGGARMQAEGFRSIEPMEPLSVMGLVEVLGNLFQLLGIRRRIKNHFIANPPDVFIGIDAPDFNLALERKLKAQGIPTVQYVSPQFWAWRQERANKMSDCVDLVLALFPFETEFYKQYKVKAEFVGHPLADDIPKQVDRVEARDHLQLSDADEVLALLPGSRRSEVKRLLPLFLETADRCCIYRPQLKLTVGAVSHDAAEYIRQQLEDHHFPHRVDIYIGLSRDLMAAADVLMVASGTVTLEAALLKRPMVVAYRMAQTTYWLAKRLVKTDHIALPNLLAGERLVPEYVQEEAVPDAVANSLLRYLAKPEEAQQLQKAFGKIHADLKQSASEKSADAVLDLIGKPLHPEPVSKTAASEIQAEVTS